MPMFNDLKTRTKLIGAFLTIALIIVIVAVVGYLGIRSVNKGMNTMYADRLLPAQQLAAIEEAHLKMQSALYRFAIASEDRDKTEQDITGQIQTAERNLKLYEATYLVPGEVQGLAKFHPAWTNYKQAIAAAMQMAKSGNQAAALQSIGHRNGAVFNAQKAVSQILNDLIAIQVRIGADIKKQGDRTFHIAKWTMAMTGLFGVIFAILLAWAISRSITSPLSSITNVASSISAGDLDASALAGITSRRDEIGILASAFTLMTGRLKETLEGLRRSQEELEERVLARTRELNESNEQLARSNNELQQFAYVASHDLQEPLRMVISYMQLLEKRYMDKLDADAREFIGFAVDGAMRMRVLIDDLLAYSRIATRGQTFQPTDSEKALKAAIGNLQIAIQDSGAQITHDPLPTVMADATQLAQLFQNLISNAIKFRRAEAPEVHIHAEPKGNFWCFSVQDNGVGIEPQYFDRIFVVFQRLQSRSAAPGTGIGLAICKKIVERHGGTIWVESELGKGTTFYFTIPGVED